MECVNVRALCSIIESLTRDNTRAYEELLGLDVNQAEKDMSRASSQQSWTVKKTKHTIHGISDSDDAPMFDPDECAQTVPALERHLQGTMCRQPERTADPMFSFVEPAPHNLKWIIEFSKCVEMLASKRESAPGPDGLPFSVYRSALGIGAKFPFAAYDVFLRVTAHPAGFGASRTVIIPKRCDVNAQGLLIRTPEALRLLTFCHCDCKIITSTVCSGALKYSIECIHPSRRCVTQRAVLDNIFEIETRCNCAPNLLL